MSIPPIFVQRDATMPEFWNERFEQKFVPWDKGGVPLAVQQYIQHQTQPADTQCLIPGCGNGYEAAYLSECGWDVVAIDFSPAAVASARAAHPDWADRIVEADFFKYQPAKPLSLIYERAFLCALPPALRLDVAARWAELLPTRGLLMGFFYITDTGSKSGPPFSISQQELNTLLAPHFVCLEDKAVDDSIAVFENCERWQIWQKK
ncbi:methyltransferase domain-containing protein [Solimicrobium silvestre]|uniref:Thiopurine S-methyltransferase (TPMT) n=1 Tax=Solimicrobium silvestre TaxID=2099400 RepID=A0A2S9H1G8_9BURK|nr:methyltransferase domain-containing protein [Solimicrobium silvestre]PRC93807.1 Thiopurine S-methyltransferase (TPMT) [Solimicrobium silvestre]